jgi:formyl-CoA transferase
MTLNLKTEEGKSIIKKLIAEADVFIENFKVGSMKKMGLDYESLSELNPALIYCSVSGYGQTGPYKERPGYDLMIQAQGGIMSITGPAEGEPHKVGVAIVDVTTGLYAVNAILSALHYRERTGKGQYIDVALLDSQLAWLVNVAHNYFATGKPPARYGNAHANLVPYETFATADGYLALAVGSNAQYRSLCELAERPDLWEDERFQNNALRVVHRELLVPMLQELFRTRPTDEWIELLLAANIPASPINDIATILNDPQVSAREMVQTIEHPTAGAIQLLGAVAKLSETPAKINRAPPLLGSDTDTILRESLDYSAEEIALLREEGVI